MVDGETVTDPNLVLRDGSELVYHRLPWKEPEAPYLLEVLYEDDDMIALNKPAGLQVLSGGLFQQRTVLTQLQWHANKNSTSPGQELHPVPVHRLGRGTSGVLLCAKTKHAKSCLAAYFADGTSLVRGKREIHSERAVERRITKIYRALVKGIIDMSEVVIDRPIGTMRYPGVARGLYVALPSGDPLYVAGGQPSCFGSELVDDGFAEDGGYQRPAKPVPGDCGYHLHAHEVTLSHPTTNEVIQIIAPLPSMLQSVEEARL